MSHHSDDGCWAGNVQYQPRRACPDCDGFGWFASDPCAVCYGPRTAKRDAMEYARRQQYLRERAERTDDA